MEIQNKEEQNTPELTEDSLQDTSAKQEEAEIQEETESQEEQNPSSNRRFLLWTLAGIYLLYTGYSLCKNVIQGAEGASTGFLLAGIAFAVVGAGLLFFSAKSMLAEDKLKKAKAAKEAGNLISFGIYIFYGNCTFQLFAGSCGSNNCFPRLFSFDQSF